MIVTKNGLKEKGLYEIAVDVLSQYELNLDNIEDDDEIELTNKQASEIGLL
jgi:hypothetical protein